MDMIDLTCEQTEADSTFALNEANVVLLDMIDVCSEVDIGDAVTASQDEFKIDMNGGMADSVKLLQKSQPAGHVKFTIKGTSSFEDFWDVDTCDAYPDSDIESQNDCLSCAVRARTITKDSSSQTDENSEAIMTVQDFRNKPDVLLFYTGLKSFERFMHIFHTLEPKCYELKYRYDKVETLHVLDQMFLTLMKLRTNKDDFELSVFFGISLESVKNIFETWIIFLHKNWAQLDFWLPKDCIDASMPPEFKSMFPTVRAVIDCLEWPISKPVNDIAQRATLSSNMNDYSLKILVGVTPSGAVSFCSEAFGGGTSESEIFKLSGILNKLEPNDAVIVDKRFNVEGICASKEVTVHTVNLKTLSGYRFSLCNDKPNNQFYPFKSLECLLGGNQILSDKLDINLLPLASEICYVSILLNNFLDS